MTNDHSAIAIVGPTASGKSRLAAALALRFGGEVVGCDAFQVYRHMDIGTAKVSMAERQAVPHHMLDLVDPDRDFSAGDYQRLARDAIRGVTARGRLPVVAGGTGFYLRALIDGLFEGPGRSDELRARMRRVVGRKGPRVLHRALGRVDPDSAARIAEMDTDRIIRAYEIYCVSGRTMTWWQRQRRDAFRGYRWLKIGIELPRERLYERIDRRVEEMFRGGLIEEARGLIEQFSGTSQAFKAIGYRQAAACLQGVLTEAEAVEETKRESRRYAKRQLTWFRSDDSIRWLDGRLRPEEILDQAADLVSAFLLAASEGKG